MPTNSTTDITIRVQARGGMFLGPDSYGGAYITIKAVESGKVLASGFTNTGGSGGRLDHYTPNASPSPIVAPTLPATIYWLTASHTAVQFTASLELSEPTLLEFTARVPLPAAQGDQFTSVTQWFIPGQNRCPGAGMVIEIPGLWVQPEIIAIQKEVRIRAKVTMMCGCEVNNNSPWLPSDFIVEAVVQSAEKSKQPYYEVIPLQFEENSQFASLLSLKQKGEFDIMINGFQRSTGNMGVAKAAFEVE